MPFAVLAVALLMLSALPASADPAETDIRATRSLPAGVTLAFDDDVYGERGDGDDLRGQPEDRDFLYGDDNDDSDDDSANAPDDDDDDGWDVDPLNRSERA